ncbi:cohesin domain-containing protein, partial [Patescibacteria group bacterium]
LNQDIAALGAQINFDPNFLKVISIQSGDAFSVGEQPTFDNSTGQINLLRGVLSNGNPDDGTATPSSDQQGLRGEEINIIKLNMEALAENSAATQIAFDNLEIAIDDGLGTLLSNFNTQDLEITILPEELRIDDLEISVFDDGNVWQVDASWLTNFSADSHIYYVVKDTSACEDRPSGDYSMLVDDRVYKTQHALSAYNLLDNQEYCLKIISRRTINPNPPQEAVVFQLINTIDNMQTLNIKNLSYTGYYNSARVGWLTEGGEQNGNATTEILSCSGGGSWVDQPDFVKTHRISVNNLEPDESYVCQVKSEDEDGNFAIGEITINTTQAQDFDANRVLKVTQNRECDKWLYCRTSMQIINEKTNQAENMCFDLGVCEKLDEDGSCVATIVYTSEIGQRFDTPSQISEIQNLSGLSKVGLNWEDGSGSLPGYYNYSQMDQVGTDLNIVENFENIEIANQDWQGINSESGVHVVSEKSSVVNANHILRVSTNNFRPDNIKRWIGTKLDIGYLTTSQTYTLSMGMRSSQGQKLIRVNLRLPDDPKVYLIDNVLISSYWQTIILNTAGYDSNFKQSVSPGVEGSPAFLSFSIPPNKYPGTDNNPELYLGENNYFEIDNLKIKPVLEVANEQYVNSSCRLYPSNTAIDCDYVDVSGKPYQGWKGFCVEPDPRPNLGNDPEVQVVLNQNESMCLNWWPVDIIAGETNIFGADEQAGYDGRQPLYYCLESASNYKGERGYFDYKPAELPTCDQCDDGNDHCDSVNHTVYGAIGWCEETSYETENWSSWFEGLYEHEIERFEFVVKRRSHSDWPELNREFVANKDNDWYVFWGDDDPFNEGRCNEDTQNYFGFKVNFDNHGEYESIEFKICDGSGGKGGVAFLTSVYMVEPCNTIAQVVKPNGENTAWSSRIQDGGWITSNNIGYEHGQDYAPYGAAVTDITDPENWEDPLYVFQLSSSDDINTVRAGSPYGARANTIGTTQCVGGTAEGDECEDGNDCPDGMCVGISLDTEQISEISGSGSGWIYGYTNLRELFAKSYGIWDWIDGHYQKRENWTPVFIDPNNIDITNESGVENYRPQVSNITINNQQGTVIINSPKSVVLKFNSEIDSNHLPLTTIRINWDDGEIVRQNIDEIGGLRINDRSDEQKPHVFTHTYECTIDNDQHKSQNYCQSNFGIESDCCVYRPRVQIEDNWGWCNGTTGEKCPTPNFEAIFQTRVIVVP